MRFLGHWEGVLEGEEVRAPTTKVLSLLLGSPFKHFGSPCPAPIASAQTQSKKVIQSQTKTSSTGAGVIACWVNFVFAAPAKDWCLDPQNPHTSWVGVADHPLSRKGKEEMGTTQSKLIGWTS